MKDDRPRNEDGRPMLHFPSMEGGKSKLDDKKTKGHSARKKDKYRSLHDPGAVSRERFKKTELEQAANFIKTFATPETREFLTNSQFGNDPIFIKAVLDTMARAKATTPEAPPLKYPAHDLDALKSRGHQIREYLEQAVYDARSSWIQQHGPIQNDQHPLDDFSEFTESVVGDLDD